MNNLRRNINRFLYQNRNRGIRNLMLYIAIGNLIVLVLGMIDPSGVFMSYLYFDPVRILKGEVWRMFTYVFLYLSGNGVFNLLLSCIFLYFFYYIGCFLEARWGTLQFNLYYVCSILITGIAALILKTYASIDYINLSLILAYATLVPDDIVYVFMILPLKMKYLAWMELFFTFYYVMGLPFPQKLFPLFPLITYFLFLGSNCSVLLPDLIQTKLIRKKAAGKARSASFHTGRQSAKRGPIKVEPLYRHKCAVCGRTDVSNPELEFRYCSKCNGYYCYCSEHINNHAHIT